MKTTINIPFEEIERKIEKLKSYSEEVHALTRPTYTLSWQYAVEYIREEMKALGMKTRIDGIGNLIGSFNPMASKEKPIAIGSHIDTVKNGGVYDGGVGIIAGLELISYLITNEIQPKCPIEIIAFAEEEGGVFGVGCLGSKYISAEIEIEALLALKNDYMETFVDIYKGSRLLRRPFLEDYGWAEDYYQAFLEVHVEQGKRLEDKSENYAIVNGVVGILRNEFTFIGEANHAGTTPMSRRKDALTTASNFILKAEKIGLLMDESLVVTTGKLKMSPNRHNIIPERVDLVLEIRGTDDVEIKEAYESLVSYAESITNCRGQSLILGEKRYTPVQYFNKELIEQLNSIDKEATNELFSWAGHDAKFMAKVTNTAMIFIPSVRGISHSKNEFTEVKDIAASIELLVKAVV